MITFSREAPAKLNLTLNVTGHRTDGFHDLESLVVQINLCDVVTVSHRDDGAITVTCDDPTLPCDETNLVVRAAHELMRTTGHAGSAHIALTKRIPLGAGLGGGSSDAAATLMLLNDLWRLKLSREQLVQIGARLGSDVPLFMYGPLSIIRGRGVEVEDVDREIKGWAAVIMPEIHCATADIYRAWDRLPEYPTRPLLETILGIRGSNNRFMGWLYNDLEEAAFQVNSDLRDLSRQIPLCAGYEARLTGSGSAFYRLFDDVRTAAQFATSVSSKLDVRTDIFAIRQRDA